MKPNNTSNITSDTLTSPITPQELSDYLSLEYNAADDALLNGFLLTSCEICIAYTQNELLARNYVYTLDRYPETRPATGGLGSVPGMAAPWIELPLTKVSDIISVNVDGLVYTDFTSDLNSVPARVTFGSYQSGEIIITYTAGSVLATSIDSRLLTGIKMLAAYLFDNRGCDTNEAVKLSGAATIWYSAKMLTGGL